MKNYSRWKRINKKFMFINTRRVRRSLTSFCVEGGERLGEPWGQTADRSRGRSHRQEHQTKPLIWKQENFSADKNQNNYSCSDVVKQLVFYVLSRTSFIKMYEIIYQCPKRSTVSETKFWEGFHNAMRRKIQFQNRFIDQSYRVPYLFGLVFTLQIGGYFFLNLNSELLKS